VARRSPASLVRAGRRGAPWHDADRAAEDRGRRRRPDQRKHRGVPGRGGGHLLRCLAPLAQATGSTEILAEADALLKVINVPPGSAWLLGWDVYLSLARAWLDQRRPARSKLILPPLIDAPRGATAGLPLWWRLVLSGLQRWPRWASRQPTCPRRSHHPRIPPRHAGRGAQCAGPAHVAATVTVGMATRGPAPRRCATPDGNPRNSDQVPKLCNRGSLGDGPVIDHAAVA
jgi:hypothetical protein